MTPDSSTVKRLLAAVDHHPRTGWYIAVVVTLNLIVTVMK